MAEPDLNLQAKSLGSDALDGRLYSSVSADPRKRWNMPSYKLGLEWELRAFFCWNNND